MQAIIHKISCFTDLIPGSAIRSGSAMLTCAILLVYGAQTATASPEAEAAGTDGHDMARAAVIKKKVALTQFDVANTLHVDDIDNIYDGLPLALGGRLESSGAFLTTYVGRPIPAESGDAQRAAITQIAGESGAQFLVSGMVVNAGTKQEKGYLGTSIGGSAKRYVEVDISVYDGSNGARLLVRRLNEQAQGDVRVGNDKPFGSSIFFETELGQAIGRLLDLAVQDIRASLVNVPFSAHIIRIEAGKVFIDAGSDSLLKPGDQLVVYAKEAPVLVGLKGTVLGAMDRAADTVTLTQVQPQFSIGELSGGATEPGVGVGSIVRIDPAEQHALTERKMEASRMARMQQEAREEAERVKAAQEAQAQVARLKAEQAAKAEAARIEAEKKAQAQARAQAAAEAKAAELKARQEARVARIKAYQEARAREQARQKARAAAEAKAAKLKAQREAKAEAARIKAEKKAQAEAEAKAAADAAALQTTPTQQVAESGVAEARAATEVATETEPARAKEKPVVTLKLKQIKP